MTRILHRHLHTETFSDWLQEHSDKLINHNAIVRVEVMPAVDERGTDGLDAVLYDLTRLDKEVKDLAEFERYITDNGDDEEVYEIDRCTILEMTGADNK